ncbi:MAG: hypothetical protein AB1705_15340 [Verrucomicrobiota bacterium]
MNPQPTNPVAAGNVLPVDFTKPRRQSYQPLFESGPSGENGRRVPGVWVDPRTGNFYWRPFHQGRQTWAKLDAKTPRRAELEVAKLKVDLALSKKGLAANPLVRTKSLAELCDFYLKLGCPKRSGARRAGVQLKKEETRVAWLKKWPGARHSASRVTPETCVDYHTWRKNHIDRGTGPGAGDRVIDLELVTLSNIFRCAVQHARQTGIVTNPIRDERRKFRLQEDVAHCRDFQPQSGDELHALARYLFQSPKSEVLGWLCLFQSMIGQRVSEMLRLRIDAKTREHAGFVENRKLWLYRSKTHKGTFPYADIHSALDACMQAHRRWLADRYPKARWFFPSPDDPTQPVGAEALSHALARVAGAVGQGHRTSHGLRSFFVNVLRSMGKSDAEIALRIGQKSGGQLIVTVYGEILPIKLGWLPKEKGAEPAWQPWLSQEESTAIAASHVEQLQLQL